MGNGITANRMSDKPWWVEAIFKFGIPAAIACYLVYVLVESVDHKLDALVSGLAAHSAIGEHQSKALDRLILISQQQCIMTAKMSRRNEQDCWK